MSCEFVFGALHGTFLIVTLTIAGLSFALRERAIVHSVAGLFEGVKHDSKWMFCTNPRNLHTMVSNILANKAFLIIIFPSFIKLVTICQMTY